MSSVPPPLTAFQIAEIQMLQAAKLARERAKERRNAEKPKAERGEK